MTELECKMPKPVPAPRKTLCCRSYRQSQHQTVGRREMNGEKEVAPLKLGNRKLINLAKKRLQQLTTFSAPRSPQKESRKKGSQSSKTRSFLRANTVFFVSSIAADWQTVEAQLALSHGRPKWWKGPSESGAKLSCSRG